MSDLKLCPFCNGEDIRANGPGGFNDVERICVDCGATAGTQEEWNSRPAEDRLKAQNADILEALEGIIEWVDGDPIWWIECQNQMPGYDFTNARKAIAAARGES